jgi:hypothetical protein
MPQTTATISAAPLASFRTPPVLSTALKSFHPERSTALPVDGAGEHWRCPAKKKDTRLKRVGVRGTVNIRGEGFMVKE